MPKALDNPTKRYGNKQKLKKIKKTYELMVPYAIGFVLPDLKCAYELHCIVRCTRVYNYVNFQN
jgi:hypothetical protein